MSNVNEYLTKKANEILENKKRSRGSEKRLTIILSEYDYRRLKFISDILSEPVSAFARNLIAQALSDAEKVLKLQETEDEPSDFDPEIGPLYEYTKYGAFINSTGNIDGDDEDTDGNISSDAHGSEQKRSTRRPRPPQR